MRPFLKWAGGKRWLFESKQFEIPEYIGCYREPFLGGGAVFFEHLPENAVLSDTNVRLIELYQVIKDFPDEFQACLSSHEKMHSSEYYYEVRSSQQKNPISRAAQFLYLNRTCWNGLYRENKKGQFNVPIGTKQTVIFPNDDFKGWSIALKNISILSCDFEAAIDDAGKGDFLFVDPPYTVKHNYNGFVKYNQNIFAWDDQVRLKLALERAFSRGANFALTNADHESIRELYNDFGIHQQVNRRSRIAGSAKHRSATTELMIVAISDT